MISWVLLCYSGLSTQKWGIPVTEMLRNGLSDAKCTFPTVNISPSPYRKLQSENHSFARYREKRCQARIVPWRPTHLVPIQKNQHIIGHCDKIILHSFVQKHPKTSQIFQQHVESDTQYMVSAKLKGTKPYSWQWLQTISILLRKRKEHTKFQSSSLERLRWINAMYYPGVNTFFHWGIFLYQKYK